MGFHYDIFPDDLSPGTAVGVGYNTSVVETDAGESYRIARWPLPKRTYNAKYAIRSHSDVVAILNHVIARKGPANGFPFRDPVDYATNATWTTHNPGDPAVSNTDESIGTGDGVAKGFQLVKRYTSGSETIVRPIALPKDGTVKVALDGVDQASGWTVNLTTGLVTFTTAPSAGVAVTAGFEFYTPVEYDGTVDEALFVDIDSLDNEQLPDILMRERTTDISVSQDYHRGGSRALTIDGIAEYSYDMGAVVVLTPTSNGDDFVLPSLTDLELGDQHIMLSNTHGSHGIDLYDAVNGTVLATLAAGKWASLYVYEDAGSKTWLIIGNS